MKLTDFDALVDRFVEFVNAGDHEPIWESDSPPSVRGKGIDDDGIYFDWQVNPQPNIDWIETLEERLGFRLPEIHRSLVSRYTFPCFDFGGFSFSGNSIEGTDFHEFRDRLFLDTGMSDTLLPNHYLQFGNPDTGGYDPICMDMNRPDDTGDYPVVWLEHESILCHGKIDVIAEITPSFQDMMTKIMDGLSYSWGDSKWIK